MSLWSRRAFTKASQNRMKADCDQTFPDLAIVILPLPAVWKLQTSLGKKIGITVMFLIGSLGFVTAMVKVRSSSYTQRICETCCLRSDMFRSTFALVLIPLQWIVYWLHDATRPSPGMSCISPGLVDLGSNLPARLTRTLTKPSQAH